MLFKIIFFAGIIGAILFVVLNAILVLRNKSAIPGIIGTVVFTAMFLVSGIFLLPTVAESDNPPPSSQEPEYIESEPSETEEPVRSQKSSSSYKIGETWSVPEEWDFTITNVSKYGSSPDSDGKYEYVIDYTFTNNGYEDRNEIVDGLIFSIVDMTVVDSRGKTGDAILDIWVDGPRATPIGATSDCQQVVVLDNEGDFVLTISQYDSFGEKQKATFNLEVS